MANEVPFGSLKGPRGLPGLPGPRGLPGPNAEVSDATFAAYIGAQDSETGLQLSNSYVARSTSPTGKEQWNFGPKTAEYPDGQLYIQYHSGFLAHRFAFSGHWSPTQRTAPTIEVVPAAPFARPDLGADYTNKVGANAINPVTCAQFYAFGHGDTLDRAYFCIEPHIRYNHTSGEYSGEYVFSAWASGTQGPGVMPVLWRAGDIDSFVISKGGIMEIHRRLHVTDKAVSNAPFLIERTNVNDQPIAQFKQVSSNALSAHLFLDKRRGTLEAPTPPAALDILGRVSGGTATSAGSYPGAEVRFIATEAWDPGTKHGSKTVLRVTPAGSSSMVDGIQIDAPTVSLDSSIRAQFNIGGTLVEKRVRIGAADSARPGYRMLMVSNDTN